MQAGALGRGGEIFILNMGTPIRIADMARDLIRLSGFQPDADVKIKFIGLRPGEKLYEELIIEGEDFAGTAHDKILVLKGNSCNLFWLDRKIEELERLSNFQDTQGILEKLKEIIPEYQPSGLNGKSRSLQNRLATISIPEYASLLRDGKMLSVQNSLSRN